MKTHEAIANTIQTADMICGAYLGDLSEDEMFHRPHAECNHLNWQVGHLISADYQMISGCCPDALPPLPEGFEEKYSKETKDNNDPAAFCTKAELMEIAKTQHENIINLLNSMSAEDLNGETPESMRGYAPTTGAAFNMIGMHWLMHCGQWVPVRRATGKPVTI